MKLSKFTLWILPILTLLVLAGCNSNSESTPMRKIDISVSIPNPANQKLSKTIQKPNLNIIKVTLSVSSSSHIYMENVSMTKVVNKNGNYWKITTDLLPIGEKLTFTAKAYNSAGALVFKGNYNGTVNNQTKSINMPLSTTSPTVEQTPSLRSIVFNNYEQTDVTFNVYNPNGDDLSYKITSLDEEGSFSPEHGTLHFSSTLQYISLHTTFTPPSVAGNYRFQFTLINSDKESFNTTFTITVTPQKTVSVYIYAPPVIDSIDSFTQENNLTVTVKAHDNANNTLTYQWEKIEGSATISSNTNDTILNLTNYQPNSPITLKVTVSNDKGSSVSRIFVSDGATVIRSLELKGLYFINRNHKLYGINNDGIINLLRNNIIRDIHGSRTLFRPIVIEGLTYFSAHDETNGEELWKSDGTTNGTVMIKDINPSEDSYPRYLTNLNGTLYFKANDGTHSYELWKSDGTANGTVMVKDINPNDNSFPYLLTNVNGTLYFGANDGAHGKELWKSDGTANGTVMVKDINPNGNSFPSYLTNINGTLYFTANDGTHGNELWKSDDTTNGTVMIKDINPHNDSYPSYLTNINGTLYFRADDGSHGEELWKSDGTANGTVMVKDISPNGGSFSSSFININGILYFTANDGTHGTELWKSDGTTNGTVMVKDINPTNDNFPSSDSFPSSFTNINGTLYFTAHDETNGEELWKSDGTANGTVMVKDINPNGSSSPHYLINVNGTLYFLIYNADNQEELWKSDGTEVGTVKVTLPE